MKDWDLYADLHTHTCHSDGQSAIAGNAQAAKARGLTQVAITDHGPANIGVGMKRPELTLAAMQEEIKAWNGLESVPEVLLGIEANVISRDGDLDLPDKLLSRLDVVVASLHPLVHPASVMDGLTLFVPDLLQRVTKLRTRRLRNANTKALVEAVNRHPVSFVGHPGLWIDIDTRELAEVCSRRGTALEINCSHADELAGYVQTAMPTGVDFVINSDAHTPDRVGRLESGVALAKRLNLPVERIRNAYIRE